MKASLTLPSLELCVSVSGLSASERGLCMGVAASGACLCEGASEESVMADAGDLLGTDASLPTAVGLIAPMVPNLYRPNQELH